MSGVRAAQCMELEEQAADLPGSDPGPEAAQDEAEQDQDVQPMVDGLYEILATGVEPDEGQVTLAEIEELLHEHAREAKTARQLKAFFEQHKLQVHQPSPELSPLQLPPLTPPLPVALPPVTLVPDPADAALGSALGQGDDEALDLQMPTGRHRRVGALTAGKAALWAALLVVVGGIAAALWFGVGLVRELRQEVEVAQQRAETQRQVIENMQGRTAGIESSIQANGELIKRMEQTGELVLHSLQERDAQQKEQAQKRRPWRRPAPSSP